MDDRISVIIPVYNREDVVIDALESVKNQTAFHLIMQIIVIDDGSTDGTLHTVQSYMAANPDLPIQLVHQSNCGVSAARNAGLRHSKGNWIAFLDSDDEWLPHKIERQFKVIDCHPEIDLLDAEANKKGLRIGLRKINKLYKVKLSDLLIKSFPPTPTVVMKKSIYDQIGGFDESRQYLEDVQYWLKICKCYNVYHLPEHLVVLGHGKRNFGDKGLSANMKEMYQGTVLNIQELKRNGVINAGVYIPLRFYNWLKYIRRILITKYYARKSAK